MCPCRGRMRDAPLKTLRDGIRTCPPLVCEPWFKWAGTTRPEFQANHTPCRERIRGRRCTRPLRPASWPSAYLPISPPRPEREPNTIRVTRIHRLAIFSRRPVVPGARLRQQQRTVIESRAAGRLRYRGIRNQPPVGAYANTNRGDPLLLHALRDRRIVVIGIRKSNSRPSLYADHVVRRNYRRRFGPR
jgi:hypothetical protein